jgi:putative acyl-CoA dehydrogenase
MEVDRTERYEGKWDEPRMKVSLYKNHFIRHRECRRYIRSINMKPATANTGFFQEGPQIGNPYNADKSLQRVLAHFVPKDVLGRAVDEELLKLGDKVISDEVFEWAEEAERNLPFIIEQDTFGKSLNKLVTSAGWKKLKEFAAEEGIISTSFERHYDEYSRVIGFAKEFIFTPNSAIVTCPLAMADGCARLIELQSPQNGTWKHEVFEHLTTRDPKEAWTSGQWMTERPGGSDVSRTETVAYNNGAKNQYLLKGFKWFSSATDSEVTVTLAHREEGKGKEGLSCFLGDLKGGGVRLHRLKEKFGTRALPTAELELSGLQAELVSEPGKGVKTIAAVLNITRVHSAIGSIGFWRRAYMISRDYSKRRSVFGKSLNQVPAHVLTLAKQEVLLRGHSFLTFYAASLMGLVETSKANQHHHVLVRLVPGLAKAGACKSAVQNIPECMEAMGGVGFLEHDIKMNIARLQRDAQVNCIWEGTTNVLCDDLVRYLKKSWQTARASLHWLVSTNTHPNQDHGELKNNLRKEVSNRFGQWIDTFELKSLEDARREARTIILDLVDILIGSFLAADMKTSGSLEDEAACKIAEKWIRPSADRGPGTDYLIVYGDRPSHSKL